MDELHAESATAITIEAMAYSDRDFQRVWSTDSLWSAGALFLPVDTDFEPVGSSVWIRIVLICGSL